MTSISEEDRSPAGNASSGDPPQPGAGTIDGERSRGEAVIPPPERHWPGSLRAWMRGRKPLVAFVAGAAVPIALFAMLSPQPVMVIDAKTRGLEYTAVNPEWSKMLFQDFAILAQSQSRSSEKQCVKGVLEPAPSSKIHYFVHKEILVVKLNEGRFLPADGSRPIDLSRKSSISYGAECGSNPAPKAPVRLPIWGPAVLGETPLPAPGVYTEGADLFSNILDSGTVQVFGRKALGDGIYAAGEIELPAGSELSSLHADPKAKDAPWWGYARFAPRVGAEEEAPVLEVSASTESRGLKLKRLGAQGHEVIEVGLTTHVFKDPLFASIAILLGGLFAWAQMVVSGKELLKWRRG